MSYRRYEIIDHTFTSPFISTTSEITTMPLPINPFLPFPCDDVILPSLSPFDTVFTDLIQIETTPFYKRVRTTHRAHPNPPPELYYLQAISDRVSSLESKFDKLLSLKQKEKEEKLALSGVDRKYTWTAEIKGRAEEKKYKWTAEIEKDNVKKGKVKKGERKYVWSTEIKGKGDHGDDKRVYTWKATIGGDKNDDEEKKDKKKKKEKEKESGNGKKGTCTRIVEIEEEESPHHHGALILRQAFARRPANNKGKKKEISPLDAAALIQMSFRAYLIRRSQALRALRELAVAKTKLKELRGLFHNFSYRNRVARDAEERQKFSEKIIVLLLTVDAIEGVDMMVRAAKRSMADELEAMLDVVDPQPTGKSLSMRRRTFDMPSGAIQKEIAEGVAQVVQMLDQEHGTFEACV